MKIVIIGGGIAGLISAITLKNNGHTVMVKEKYALKSRPGLAFLIHSETLDFIRSINTKGLHIESQNIDQFQLLNPGGELQMEVALAGWSSLKRVDLITFLIAQLTAEEFKESSIFSHFEYRNSKAIAAVFKDGSKEYGDLFIGSDGINSSVRESVCKASFYPNQINEVVCIIKGFPKNSKVDTFKKYQALSSGIAFGFIPLTNDDHVWFCQYDSTQFAPLYKRYKENLKTFISELLKEFPAVVKEIVLQSDFNNAFEWINKELQLPETYHKDNICLIGDAAHGTISLTSSGVSSGINSAIELTEALQSEGKLEDVLNEYEKIRKEKHSKKIKIAQSLKKQFLSTDGDSKNYILPLVK